MSRLLILCLAIFIPFVFTSCASAAEGYRKITPQEGKDMIEKKITLVDVREPSEYEEGHIPSAILIPLGTIDERVTEKLTDKDAPVILYCRSGVRSRKAAMKLIDLGYKDVRDMGGILDWPYEVTK